MNTYHIWTVGCQMNEADSERLASAFDQIGLTSVTDPEDADVVVLNSCVVRQSAEDKVISKISFSQNLKKTHPEQMLVLMGCMVGPESKLLSRRFPEVDMFVRPQEINPLLDSISEKRKISWEGCVTNYAQSSPGVSCNVPIIQGCDFMCSFCIIPYRRGRQVSRSIQEIVDEIKILTDRGVKEVTLLGQTVDAYGHDFGNGTELADLLFKVHEIDNLERIRFLTSHPSFMSQRIIESIRDLPKVCENINLPIQAGNDLVLERMRRPYSTDHYKKLLYQIRNTIPDVTVSTDIIVGFPGETDDQFQETLKLVEDLEFSKVHCAAYSVRPGTIAERRYDDDVPRLTKIDRRQTIDETQKKIQEKNNLKCHGSVQSVLIESRRKNNWIGRNRNDKLVYTGLNTKDLSGQLVDVKIDETSAWSLKGSVTNVGFSE
jgi:tRNA-2-methylthio-N6-dimethylallyladenosine synthase